MASGLENIETIESPFRRFVTTIGVFPTAFTDAMTYYECLAYLVKYMEDTMIPAINENAEAVKELQGLYIQLKTFVDTYFANLDVQEEINNKLDEMAKDGTLQEIITTYIQSNVAWTFDNVAEMKTATNLVDGSYARTLGFHSINDGGGATYKILSTGTANEKDVIAVGSLFAHLVDAKNVRQFGAYGDNEHNDTDAIQRAFDTLSYIEINDGTYLVGQVSISTEATVVKSHAGILKAIDSDPASSILLIQNDGVKNVKIEGLTIDGNKANNSSKIDGIYITRTVYADCFGLLKDVEIKNCSGNGINITAANNALVREMKFVNIHSHHNDGNGLRATTMTDSFISLSVFENNKLNGIYLSNTGSIKISQVKCYWNGINSSEDIDVDRLEAGEMIVTSDATPQAGKSYYTRTGTGNWQDSYVYTKYTGSSFGGDTYYEIKSANYKSRSHGIKVDNSSVILIINSEMQANAGDGLHFTSVYNSSVENTSLDNNGYYFDENNQAYSYNSLGIKPFYAGVYCYNCKYTFVNATTLNAFYNYQGISQGYGACLKNSTQNRIDITSRLQTAPVQLLNLNPEDVYVQVNGNLLPIEMSTSYNITDVLEGYELDASSKMYLIGSKVRFQIYIKNDSGVTANQDLNICKFNLHLRPQYSQIIKSAFMSQYYTNYNNGSVVQSVLNKTTGVIAFRTATASMKYINLTDEIALVQR